MAHYFYDRILVLGMCLFMLPVLFLLFNLIPDHINQSHPGTRIYFLANGYQHEESIRDHRCRYPPIHEASVRSIDIHAIDQYLPEIDLNY